MNNNNQNRPDYNPTALGWIPNDWEIVELREVTEKKRPISYGIVQTGGEGNVKCVRVVDLENGRINPKNLITTTEKISNSYKRTILKENDLVIALRGKIGEVAVVDKSLEGNNLTRGVALIAAKENYSPIFLYHQLTSPLSKRVLERSLNGSALQELSIATLRKIPVIIPKQKSEQCKIASILTVWDRAIIETQNLIFELRQGNKGLVQQLLKPKTHWREYHINDLLKEVQREVEWSDEHLYHLISVRRRSGGAFYRGSLYGKQILTKQLFTAEEGDFLISKMQIVHGASAVVPKELAGMKISGSYIAVHAKDENVLDINFFNWLSKTPFFYHLTYISSYGVHIEKMTFDFEDFIRRKIKLPPTVEEQKGIAKVLQTGVEEIRLYEQKLAFLQKQKKGLMQQLLTGTKRVKL